MNGYNDINWSIARRPVSMVLGHMPLVRHFDILKKQTESAYTSRRTKLITMSYTDNVHPHHHVHVRRRILKLLCRRFCIIWSHGCISVQCSSKIRLRRSAVWTDTTLSLYGIVTSFARCLHMQLKSVIWYECNDFFQELRSWPRIHKTPQFEFSLHLKFSMFCTWWYPQANCYFLVPNRTTCCSEEKLLIKK